MKHYESELPLSAPASTVFRALATAGLSDNVTEPADNAAPTLALPRGATRLNRLCPF